MIARISSVQSSSNKLTPPPFIYSKEGGGKVFLSVILNERNGKKKKNLELHWQEVGK